MNPIELVERLGRWSSGRGPLYVLLAGGLRQLIDEGELPSGTLLPPDRTLAKHLTVGRSTVVAAYELLMTEGRIVRRQGSGTRVAGDAPTPAREVTSTPFLLHLLDSHEDVIQLACATPETAPREIIAAYERAMERLFAGAPDMGYHPYGHPYLRACIADRYRKRGVPTEPEQIIVTTGGQQALSLLARSLLKPGLHALVEAPTYPGALEVFRDEGAVLHTLPVGLPDLASAARRTEFALAYLIPTYQNPTGAVLPALMRRRLVEEATAAGIPLIEDEVLADLRFPGEETPPPLAAFCDSVISVGSLSKVLWGGLRTGWIRAPIAQINRLARLRAVHELGGNVPAQLAAGELLTELDRLNDRAAPIRERRHDHLCAELARLIPEWEITPVRGGQSIWVRIPHGTGASFVQAALRQRVTALAGNGLDASGGSHEYLRLQFMAAPEVLTEAVQRLAAAWESYRPPREITGTPPVMAV
ncbi:MAG TPA: PLP-dependent aminotransferase family protein [Mycobacteriales bacterium]|nr:PLP-dependent aminotransferase family protein [Mycobacteriales bacterium]